MLRARRGSATVVIGCLVAGSALILIGVVILYESTMISGGGPSSPNPSISNPDLVWPALFLTVLGVAIFASSFILLKNDP